jgi:hypothetical protein
MKATSIASSQEITDIIPLGPLDSQSISKFPINNQLLD